MPTGRIPDPRGARRPATWRAPAAVAALALLAIAASYWWPTRGVRPPPPERGSGTVVFLGDSITSGHGLPLETTFPLRLGATLGVPVRNAGISGDLTAGGVRRLETDVLVHRPQLVVVELGVNDVFRRLPREETLRNLQAIVHRVRESGAGVVLVHISLSALGGEDYRTGFRRIAEDEGAWLVEDFLDGVVPNLTTDGLHPNEEGHARLAAKLEPLLRDILAR